MYFLLLKIVSHIYVDSNIGGIIGTLRKSIVPIVSYPCVVMPEWHNQHKQTPVPLQVNSLSHSESCRNSLLHVYAIN